MYARQVMKQTNTGDQTRHKGSILFNLKCPSRFDLCVQWVMSNKVKPKPWIWKPNYFLRKVMDICLEYTDLLLTLMLIIMQVLMDPRGQKYHKTINSSGTVQLILCGM